MATKKHKKAQAVFKVSIPVILCASLWLIPFFAWAEETQDPTLSLARGLALEGDHAGAAVEFRRRGLEVGEAVARGGYFWASAYEYQQADRHEVSDRMLDSAEDAEPGLGVKALLLRAENTAAQKRWKEEAYYRQSILDGQAPEDMKRYTALRLAEARLRLGEIDEAREALQAAPGWNSVSMEALDEYVAGHDKSPKTGGLLGMIPGMGYMYAGEYGNGFRSIILNSLFIFGMVSTAQDDQWGAFAVITFFEFTWYSGSIYGGVDASHRYNRDRLESCIDHVRGDASFEPDYEVLPSISLKFKF